MTKRILVVCQHFWPENFRINDICDYLVEHDYDVEVICGIPNYPKGKFYDGYGWFKQKKQVHNGVKIRRCIEIKRGRNTNIRIFFNYISFPITSFFKLPYLFCQNYDKIFLYQLSPVMMSAVGLILGRLKRIETILYVCDLWPENLYSVLNIKSHFLRSIAYSVSTWHYRKTDKLITISNKMKDLLITRTLKTENQIIFIPQVCEKVYEQEIIDVPLVKKYESGFNLVFTGNISPAQSFETVIVCAKKLKEDGIHDLRWIIVGDGMSKKWLEKQVTNENLDDCFYFEGFVPMSDIPKYTHIADALLGCLSKSSFLDCTIPAKVFSYFAAGKPLLLAMDGEIQDIVRQANAGLICNTEDSEMLYRNVKLLYSMSKEQREEMGKNAKRYHFQNFERSKNFAKMIDFLEN